MPFTQPTGVSFSGSRGTLTTPHTIANTAPSLISNTSATSLPTHKTIEPEKLCQVRNQWVRSAGDSIHIFTKTWQPLNIPVLSVVVFVHDIMEHCERYLPLFVQFAARGIEVQAFDLPGFGETGAREDAHGITGGYDVLLKEIDSAIDRAHDTHPTLPIFLMGHGMGGALVLNYVCGLGQRTPLLAGIISSSPYLQPTIRGAGMRFPSTYNRLGKWYPNVSVGFRIQAEELTRDLGEIERVLGDGLIRDSVSLQCLGDMIYQGQKVLKKRWKKFPAPLPILLLHGTNDPICSYQATQALSSQLLKLQPLNFRFKSWKDNMHDPHWDLDANTVRSEYTTWIRNNCRHFDKLPLEPSMVHWDSIRSSRSAATSSRSTLHHSSSSDDPPNKGGKKDKKMDKKREKQEKEERERQEKLDKAEKKKQQKLAGKQGAGPTVPEAGQDGTQVGGEAPGTVKPEKVVSAPASAEPEVIQDLDGLRRQQEMNKQKAIDKRREYNLDPPLTSASEASPDTAGPVVDEQHQQQQAGQVPSDSPAPPLGDQHQQGVIPTVITEPCTPTTSTPPHLVPLPNTSQSSLSSQQDPAGLQSTISNPVVKEQTEMEKSLEIIAQTLSRHNSLNRLSTATTATAVGISGSVSLPALGEATSMLGVELAVDTISSVIAVDVHDAPTAVAPPLPLLKDELSDSTALQPPASITNAEDIVETTATIQAEEIIPLKQEQEQGQQQEQRQGQEQGQGYINTPDSVVHVDYSPEAPPSSSSIKEEAPEQVAQAVSLASPECATSHPGQFPSPTLTPTATIASIVREAPTDSKVDDTIAS